MIKLFTKNLKYILSIFIVIPILSFDSMDASDPIATENSKPMFFGNHKITDGPYIYTENNKTIVKWIRKNRVVERTIPGDNFKIIKRKFGFDFKPEWISSDSNDHINYKQDYKEVENLIALSDIHGQYEVFVRLLMKYDVIDAHYNWKYGTGHLVILGDIFDRGSRVTESLWLIFKLEQQAKEHGGKVHFLLGNHELMMLHNDTRYINEKYIQSSQLMKIPYSQMYSENSVLGCWLRTKPVMVTINDLLFVHAGISIEFLKEAYTVEKTNKIFIEEITGKSWDHILNDSTLTFMTGSQGPIWYRGYFENPVLKDYQIDHLLKNFNTNHILVGHTSLPNITSLYNGKVIGIDSGIQFGDYGEVFMYKKGEMFRGTLNGSILKL